MLIRIITAIFSQGYGMHDDHFLVVEAPASWAHGEDYSNWLPWNQKGENIMPQGHSYTYIGAQFIFFKTCEGLGISNPKTQMLINRLLHGLWSVLIVVFVMKIVSLYLEERKVVLLGLVTALLWIVPFLSVRNLVEFLTIPFLLICMYWILNTKFKKSHWFMAGVMLGTAISIRYQLGVFALGLGLALLISKRWMTFLFVVLGSVITVVVTQGIVDYFIWEKPFAELMGYVNYNLETDPYIKGPWYMFVLVLMGAFLVPLGFVLAIGFFAQWRKYLVLFLPTFLFLLFHSWHPNRQERFILPILFFFLILGYLGWEHLKSKYNFWSNKKLTRWIWGVFWVLNTPLLLTSCFVYSKKSRVESAYYLRDKKVLGVIQESTGPAKSTMIPKFYSDNYTYLVYRHDEQVNNLGDFTQHELPMYVFFYGDDNLEDRIKAVEKYTGPLKREAVFEPGFVDRWLYQLNPKNNNETIVVYSNR